MLSFSSRWCLFLQSNALSCREILHSSGTLQKTAGESARGFHRYRFKARPSRTPADFEKRVSFWEGFPKDPAVLKILRRSISNSLMGSFGKGSLQKIFRNFPRNFRNFPQNFRTLSWRNKAYFLQISANFPQNFRKLSAKNPFANDPISVLLIVICLGDWFFTTTGADAPGAQHR